MIHYVVTSDLFALFVGAAGIVAALASTIALFKINKITSKKKIDSNQNNSLNQSIHGDSNQMAGRDIKRD